MYYKMGQLPVFYRCHTIRRRVFDFDAAVGVECSLDPLYLYFRMLLLLSFHMVFQKAFGEVVFPQTPFLSTPYLILLF